MAVAPAPAATPPGRATPSTRVLAALVLVVLAGAAAATARPVTRPVVPARALQRYAPVLVLAPGERFSPERVDGFLADSTLVGGHYDQTSCQAVGGPDSVACYAAADGAHAPKPAVYGAVRQGGGRTLLEYWLFYYFDLFQPLGAPPLDQFWQDHEGDWEAVAVVLDAAGKPLTVATSRHCGGARRDWARVQRRGTHPVVYVALGSHANFFRPGEVPLDRACFPPVALAVYDAYKVTLRDHVAAGPTLTPQVLPVTATTPDWMTFAGAWGETQYVHFPDNAPFGYGLGPRGPAFHALWRKPLATVLAWPAG